MALRISLLHKEGQEFYTDIVIKLEKKTQNSSFFISLFLLTENEILVSRKDAKHFYQSSSEFQGKSGVSIRTWLCSKKFGFRSICYA